MRAAEISARWTPAGWIGRAQEGAAFVVADSCLGWTTRVRFNEKATPL